MLESVFDMNDHSAADDVHKTIPTRTPGLSRTTLHRTLGIFAHTGVITKACHPGSVVRYDTRLDIHHHLVCERNDNVMDISDDQLDALRFPILRLLVSGRWMS